MDDALDLTRRAEATHFWFVGFRKLIAPVLHDLAGGRPDLRLLDCGCGVGQNLALLDPYGRVCGFDVTLSALVRARALGRPVVHADVRRSPFLSNSFDLAVSFDVLPFVADDQVAVREMARVLKPGGAAVVTVAALEMLRGDHSEAWGEQRRYTPTMVRRLAEDAGLQVERVAYLFGSLFPLMVTVRAWQRLRRRLGRPPRPDSDIAVPPDPINRVLALLVSGEAALARQVRLPVGSSLLLVARKPATRS